MKMIGDVEYSMSVSGDLTGHLSDLHKQIMHFKNHIKSYKKSKIN